MDKVSKWLALFLLIYAALGIGHLFLAKQEKPVGPIELEHQVP